MHPVVYAVAGLMFMLLEPLQRVTLFHADAATWEFVELLTSMVFYFFVVGGMVFVGTWLVPLHLYALHLARRSQERRQP